LPQSVNRRRINCCQPIPELNKTADAWGMLDSAPLSDVIELRKKITWKHSFYEPDSAPLGQFAHPQARSETSDLVLFSQTNSGEVLAFSLGAQAKPKWSIGRENLWLRLRHSARLIAFIPTKKRSLFNSSYFRWRRSWISAALAAAISTYKFQPDRCLSPRRCPKE
jgi:hypothetical protein